VKVIKKKKSEKRTRIRYDLPTVRRGGGGWQVPCDIPEAMIRGHGRDKYKINTPNCGCAGRKRFVEQKKKKKKKTGSESKTTSNKAPGIGGGLEKAS